MGERKKAGVRYFVTPPDLPLCSRQKFWSDTTFYLSLTSYSASNFKDFFFGILSWDRWPGQSVTLPQLYIPDVPPRTSTEVKIFLVLYAWENRSAKLFAELLNNMTALTEIRSLKYV